MIDLQKLEAIILMYEAFPPNRLNEYGKTALECMRLVLAAKSAESEVEAVARALCKEDRLDPDEDPNYVDGTVMTAVAWPPEARLWWRYRRQACAALTTAKLHGGLNVLSQPEPGSDEEARRAVQNSTGRRPQPTVAELQAIIDEIEPAGSANPMDALAEQAQELGMGYGASDWNAGARVMREKAQQVCLEYEAGYDPSESASERLACRECARMIGFIPIPQAALPHSQVMCDETWNTGAEAMREAAALYMDVEEQSGYADAIRDIPIPARPK